MPELRPQGRQGWRIPDACRQGGRRGDNDPPGLNFVSVRDDPHAVVPIGYLPHGGRQHDAITKRVRHPDRQQLRAADKAQLLGAVPDSQQPLQGAGRLLVAGGSNIEEGVQERDIAGFGAPKVGDAAKHRE